MCCGRISLFFKRKYPKKFLTGADVRQDLLAKAKKIVKGVNFKKEVF